MIQKRLTDIAGQRNGFKFAEPWRYSDNSIVAVLPITRVIDAKRDYITLVEAAEQMEITEKGSINELIVKNKSEMPVFLRAGEMLKGATQERAVIIGQIVLPGEERILEVVCVHATRGLARGATMSSAGYTPPKLYDTIYEKRGSGAYRLQSETWAEVASAGTTWTSSLGVFTDRLTRQGVGEIPVINSDVEFMASDDLITMQDSYSKAINDLLNKVPKVENQVGLATIGIEGLLALECYDLGDSWKAVREAAVQQYGEDLSKILEKSEQLFQFVKEGAYKAVSSTLEDTYESKMALEDTVWKTLALKSEKYSGEATLLNDKVIHLLLTSKES